MNKTQLGKKNDARTIVLDNGKRNKDKKKTADHTMHGRIVTIDHATPNRAVKVQKNKHASPFVNKKRNVFIQQENAQVFIKREVYWRLGELTVLCIES
jgi:hypothetical protein